MPPRSPQTRSGTPRSTVKNMTARTSRGSDPIAGRGSHVTSTGTPRSAGGNRTEKSARVPARLQAERGYVRNQPGAAGPVTDTSAGRVRQIKE